MGMERERKRALFKLLQQAENTPSLRSGWRGGETNFASGERRGEASEQACVAPTAIHPSSACSQEANGGMMRKRREEEKKGSSGRGQKG